MAIRNKITKQGKDVPSKLSESYAQAVEEIRKRSEKFREEFSKTMQDFVGEQKTALEQIIEVVDGGGKQKENKKGSTGKNLNNFVEKIVVEIKRKICEWQSLLKYAIFAM